MPGKRPSVKNEKQYEALKKMGMSKARAAGSQTLPTRRGTGASSPAPVVTRGKAGPPPRRRPPGERAARPPRRSTSARDHGRTRKVRLTCHPLGHLQ